MFPVIKHISDVLPHIEGKDEIKLIKKDDYQVLDYVYAGPDTFDNPYALECRGIKFDDYGKIIARPFHKFFNLGEKPASSMEALDWSASIDVMDKLDGSMIHPALIDGKLWLMTRKGITDTALQAMEEADYDENVMIAYINMGYTPIYEYVSPNNRIVLDYAKPELVMIGLRETISGGYAPLQKDRSQRIGDPKSFVDMARNLKGKEGFVLAWENGHRVKIKADDYVQLHRNIDLAGSEKRVLEVIFDNSMDDLLPMLDDARKELLTAYADKVTDAISRAELIVSSWVHGHQELSQKEFAILTNKAMDKRLRPACFKMRAVGWDSADTYSITVDAYRRLFRTQNDIDENRDLIHGAIFKSRPM